ncbi:MAG: glycosyltransferase [Phycisphaera sp. TMED9]|nr:MAG: glycosyltransferase [Phycisphaera sp. TMED9]
MTFERESSTDVAVVIPAWNEAEDIEATVSTLRDGLAELGRSSELLVVDDSSEDDTAAIAEGAGATTLKVEKRQIAAVRNAGAATTTGRLLVFVDADTLVPSETLRELIRAVEQGAAIAGPRVEMPGVRSPVNRLWTWLLLRALANTGVLPGCCLVMRREIFDAVDGFDEQWFASEEVWLVKSIRALGRGPVTRVDAPVYTSPRKANAVGPWRLLWQTISIGMSGPRRWRDRSRLRFWYQRDSS